MTITDKKYTNVSKDSRILRSFDGLLESTEDQRNADWLSSCIKRSAERPFSTTVRLTPSLARELLKRNPDNRRISPIAVDAYARDMRNNAWTFNGEPIIVSDEGLLNDGQHRCYAVVASECSIEAIIVFGTSRESRFTIDQGKIRTAADFLGMNGEVDVNVLAACASYVWQYRNTGKLSSQGLYRPTKSEILHTVQETPELSESIRLAGRKGSAFVGGKSILSFCHWVFAKTAGAEAARAFIDALIDGANLGPKDPVLYARNRLMNERGRLKVNEKAELIFRAWNFYRRGQKVASFPIKNGTLPTVER